MVRMLFSESKLSCTLVFRALRALDNSMVRDASSGCRLTEPKFEKLSEKVPKICSTGPETTDLLCFVLIVCMTLGACSGLGMNEARPVNVSTTRRARLEAPDCVRLCLVLVCIMMVAASSGRGIWLERPRNVSGKRCQAPGCVRLYLVLACIITVGASSGLGMNVERPLSVIALRCIAVELPDPVCDVITGDSCRMREVPESVAGEAGCASGLEETCTTAD
mmetsp:Transcript_120539/g.312973  ORF Transcript_120539/g.312973 Transcript_120539/m.312973 type:complete len:221 (+) Transcript_120539:255-917(+)